jgi:selenocysteine lyase/cysteine desulfurase
MNSLEAALTDRTRIVATVHASNAVGTINPVARIAEMAHAAGAYHVVDAVQSAPHLPLDVQAIGCDFLLCSAYKFFGPHMGLMWGRHDLLAELPVYKVRPAKDKPPYRWETGTPSFEGILGVGAALAYLGQIGRDYGGDIDVPGVQGTAQDLKRGMEAIRQYEQGLAEQLIATLEAIPGVTIAGITDPDRLDERCPTVVFTHETHTPDAIAAGLATHDIYVWSGHYYAIEIMERLGHPEHGMVRVGLAHYNTRDEIDRFGQALTSVLNG